MDLKYDDIEAWRDWLAEAPSLKTASRRAVRRSDYAGPLEPKSVQEVEQLTRLAGDWESLAAITQRDIFARLSTALALAVKRHYIEFNPCDTVGRPDVGQVRRKAPPRADSIARLLRQIESEKWGAAVVVSLVTGLRKGEVLALKWEDIEWKAPGFPGFGAVFIGRQVQRLGRGVGLLVREAVKSDASEATLPLPPVVLAALERRRKEQTTEMLRAPKPRTALSTSASTGVAATFGLAREASSSRLRSGPSSTLATSTAGSQRSAAKRTCPRATRSTAASRLRVDPRQTKRREPRGPGHDAPRPVHHHGRASTSTLPQTICSRQRRQLRLGSRRRSQDERAEYGIVGKTRLRGKIELSSGVSGVTSTCFCGKNLSDLNLVFGEKLNSPNRGKNRGKSWEKPWKTTSTFSHFPVFLERKFRI